MSDVLGAKFAKLGVNNYAEWVRPMPAILHLKNLFRLVDGKITGLPKDDKQIAAWKNNKEKAAGLICLALEELQMVHIEVIMHDPGQLWRVLEAYHVQKQPTSCLLPFTPSLVTQTGQQDLARVYMLPQRTSQ